VSRKELKTAMADTPEILISSVVVLGSFNPAIFTPDWLEQNELIGSADAEVARNSDKTQPLVVTRQVAALETEWFLLQVTEEKFTLTSKGPISPTIRDLAAGIFHLVPHTPVGAVGLNFDAHYKCASPDDYHKVGDTLAPKTIWNALYPDQAAGLIDLTIKIEPAVRGEKPESKDYIRFSVQPSQRIQPGVFVAYNAHHVIEPNLEGTKSPAEKVADHIDENWEITWKDAVGKAEKLMKMSMNG
jgi:hypothetical protein